MFTQWMKGWTGWSLSPRVGDWPYGASAPVNAWSAGAASLAKGKGKSLVPPPPQASLGLAGLVYLRLLEGQRSINDREERANETDRVLKKKEEELEEGKLHSADAKLAEASRKSSEIDRKLADVEAREHELHKDYLSLNAEQKTYKKDLDEQREHLREWEKNLQESQKRLLEGQRSINDREERANETDRVLKKKEEELEEARKMIEVEKSNASEELERGRADIARELELERGRADIARGVMVGDIMVMLELSGQSGEDGVVVDGAAGASEPATPGTSSRRKGRLIFTSEMTTGELDAEEGETRSESISLGGRRKRHQISAPGTQTLGEEPYNFRRSTM